MGVLLYWLATRLYYLAVLAYSPFNPKARKFISGRRKTFDHLRSNLTGNRSRVIWFHCASLGEFEQGRPLIEACRHQFPDSFILLTFFSPSGYEHVKDYSKADAVTYLPFDSVRNARKFIEIVKPSIAVFIRYEYWYYFLREVNKAAIPVISVSSDFRSGQLFFKWWGKFYRKALHSFSAFFVQNRESVELLHSIGIGNVTKAGDTRFDRVLEVRKNSSDIPYIQEFKGNNELMIAGSSWPEDIDVLISLINQDDGVKFIIAPHEISEDSIKRTARDIHKTTILYSQLPSDQLKESQVLIVDRIGLLSRLYRYADYAYVGGAFGPGVHNVLEPAVFGIPVFYGNKNYSRWRESVELRDSGGGFPVGGTDELTSIFKKMRSDREYYLRTCEASSRYIEQHAGAKDKVMNYITQTLA